MLLVHLHYPNADRDIGFRFAGYKGLFAVGELYPQSRRLEALLPRLVGARQAEAVVGALVLEGLAAAQAGSFLPSPRARRTGRDACGRTGTAP